MKMRTVLALLAAAAALSWAAEPGTPEDEAAIRKVIADRAASFNRHEDRINPAGFSVDFDLVNPRGDRKIGIADLREMFQTVLRNAHMVESIERIRFIRPDVALVDGKFEVSGTEIRPYPKGFQVWVLVKENGRWLITAIRQMNPAVP